MKKIFFTIILAAISFTVANAQNENVDNTTILNLLIEGYTSDEIIGTIEHSSNRNIEYGLDYMRMLKRAGADEKLITYIQKTAKTDKGYDGVYWWNTKGNDGKPKQILRSEFEKERKGFSLGKLAVATITGTALVYVTRQALSAGVAAAVGSGAVILASTAKDLQKIYIAGKTSKNIVNTRTPVFRFYLKKHAPSSFEKEADSWYQTIMNEVQNPNEFQVVKLEQKHNRRRFDDDCKWEIAGFKYDKKERYVKNFDIKEISNNIFEVSFPTPLEPGEYIFFWKHGLSDGDFQQHPFGFDFSIQ